MNKVIKPTLVFLEVELTEYPAVSDIISVL